MWKRLIVVAGAPLLIVLGGCGTQPPAGTLTPQSPSATTSTTPSPSGPSPVFPSPTASIPPAVVSGPTLSESQFRKLIEGGKIGDRTVELFDTGRTGTVEGKGGEETQAQTVPQCKEQYSLAKKSILQQASDDQFSVVVQRFKSAAALTQTLAKARECSAELDRRGIQEGPRVVRQGGENGLMWQFTRRPTQPTTSDAVQVMVGYGNVLTIWAQRGNQEPNDFARLYMGQIERAGR